jgi:hypothetical protein
MVNGFVGGSGVEGFAGLVACSPNAEARTRAITKRKRVENGRFCFIFFVYFLATWIN